MPGCAAVGCNNRSEKGYTMKCFPRDPKLRKIWKERVGRADWEPSNNSFLCHVHFDPQQWMVMHSGKIKLKKDAMPSIFTVTSTRKSPKKRSKLSNWESLQKDGQSDDEYFIEYLEEDSEFRAVSAEDNTGGNDELDETESAATVYSKMPVVPAKNGKYEHKNHSGRGYRIAVTEKLLKDHLEKENIIIVSDENNREIGKLVHNDDEIIIVAHENNQVGQIDERNSVGTRILSASVSPEPETNSHAAAQSANDNSYDEIEAKLKQICDGEGMTEDSTIRSKGTSEKIKIEKNAMKNDDRETDFGPHTTVTSDSVRTPQDKEIPRDVKMIFGTESGDESRNTSDHNSPRKRDPEGSPSKKNIEVAEEIQDESARKKAMLDEIKDLEDESKSIIEDIEKTCSREEIHVIPNMRAAMKRKIKDREAIMKSIERSITQVTDSVQLKLEIDDRSTISSNKNMQKDSVNHTERECMDSIENILDLNDHHPVTKKTKFTIKVSGVPGDVTEIIKEMGPVGKGSTYLYQRHIPGRECNIPKDHRENAFINSVIAVQEQMKVRCEPNEEELSEYESPNAEEYIIPENFYPKSGKSNRKQLLKIRQDPSEIQTLFKCNEDFIHTEEFNTKNSFLSSRKSSVGVNECSIVRKNLNNEGQIRDEDSESSVRIRYSNKHMNPHKELQQKINAQKEVINKLTSQLIVYKELEGKVVNLNLELQLKNKEVEMLRMQKKSTSPQDRFGNKKDLEMKQKRIQDLASRVNQLEETNKKLMKTIAMESQVKRKLESRIRQRDERIKELNWKLGKASKYLDRAEKNMNTYKRKMLSMQTSMRRQKASEEKRSRFKELLIDHAKHEFSELALLTAMDIKNNCGRKCYEKLLSYDFPLPSLRTLRRHFQTENVIEDDWGDEESTEATETEVTGTVQDIFEENNDGEDLNSSELREHFILHLDTTI